MQIRSNALFSLRGTESNFAPSRPPYGHGLDSEMSFLRYEKKTVSIQII